MNALRLFVMMAGLLAVSMASAGTLYKIVGKDGKVTYTSRPPANASGKVERKDLRVTPGEPGAAEALSQLAEDKPITLYSVGECEQCDRAREYLQKRGVPFTERDVNKDPNYRGELKNRTGSLYIPTIIVGEKIMKGYIQSLLEGELDAAGYPRESVSPEGQGNTRQTAEDVVQSGGSGDTNVTEGGAGASPEESGTEAPAQ